MNNKYLNAKQALHNSLRGLTDQANELNEVLRLRDLQSLGIMYTLRESDFDDLVNLATISTNSESGFITFIDDEQMWIKALSTDNKFARIHDRSDTICTLLVKEPEKSLLINDTVNDQRVRDFKFVKSGDVGSYLGVPIMSNNGNPLGSVCCTNVGTSNFTYDQLNALSMISRIITRLLYK